MRIRKVLALASLSLVFGTCHAEQRMITGEGTMSCAAYIEVLNSGPSGTVRAEGWALGYMSALNMHFLAADVLKNTDVHGLTAAIKQYCEQNPLKQLATATYAVLGQLGGRKTSNNGKK